MKKKILLVDDERDIVEFLSYNLKNEDFDVVVAFDGEEALQKLDQNPDLIILDVMMPKMNGFEACEKIRETRGFESTPIIFLTAKVSEQDEVKGLELGANDYIHKPISPKKLIARVNAGLRGKEATAIDQFPKIEIGPLVIDKERYVVFLDKVECVFPRKEFELLYYLAGSPGIVFSRESLLKDVWGSDVFVVDRTVDVHIRKIREKLCDYADLIETVKGVGYRFKAL